MNGLVLEIRTSQSGSRVIIYSGFNVSVFFLSGDLSFRELVPEHVGFGVTVLLFSLINHIYESGAGFRGIYLFISSGVFLLAVECQTVVSSEDNFRAR